MSLLNTLLKGRQALRDQHNEGETEKKGTLRGGSSGILTSTGEVYGTCPRISYLRKLGFQVEVEPYADILFAAGYANEDIVAAELEAAGETIKREEEVPVVWSTENGTVVSGRPDIIIMDGETKKVGLELKLISSIWTAKSVLGTYEPKSDHLIQAAHYSWQHEIPWKLLYANRAYWHINYNKFLTTAFQGNEYCEDKEGRPFRVLPAYLPFDVEWQEGSLYYSKEGVDDKIPTVITKEGIEAYYEAVSRLTPESNLPPIPVAKHVNGGKSYKPCDYCPLAAVCEKYQEEKLSRWTDEAILEINTLAEERKLV